GNEDGSLAGTFAREVDGAQIQETGAVDDIAGAGVDLDADGAHGVVVGDRARIAEKIVGIDGDGGTGRLDLHAAGLDGDVAVGGGVNRVLLDPRDGGVGAALGNHEGRSQQRSRGGGKHQAVLRQNPNLVVVG